jgi:hypothetical protein
MRKTVELPATRSMDLFFKTLGFEPYIYPMPAIVGGFSKDSPAQKQGLLVGDEIKKTNETINSNEIFNLTNISKFLKTLRKFKIIQLETKTPGIIIEYTNRKNVFFTTDEKSINNFISEF